MGPPRPLSGSKPAEPLLKVFAFSLLLDEYADNAILVAWLIWHRIVAMVEAAEALYKVPDHPRAADGPSFVAALKR